MKSFLHTGDLGDIIYALPILKTLGKARLYFLEEARPNIIREPITSKRFKVLYPLLECQEYLAEVAMWGDQKIDYNLRNFRVLQPFLRETLIDWQSRFCEISVDYHNKWLDVPPHDKHDLIVINRTLRYNNPAADKLYRELISSYNNDIVFIGLPDEHEKFSKDFGKISYLPTKNLLEVAKIIVGGRLFVGNQSCCYAIAQGLKVKNILEASMLEREQNCYYHGENNIHITSDMDVFNFLSRGQI